MLPHSDGLDFTQNLEDLDWRSCQSTSPLSDTVSAHSSIDFLGPSSDYRSLWLSPGIHNSQHQHQHTEPFVDSYFSLDFPSDSTDLSFEQNPYPCHDTIDGSPYCQFGQMPTSENSPLEEDLSPYSDQVALSSLSSPSIEDTEGHPVDGYHSIANMDGIGLHQSKSTSSLISANESLPFQNMRNLDPVYDANFNIHTPDSSTFSGPMIQARHPRHQTQYHEPGGFKCGWVGCKLIGKFGSEASLLRHIRSVHISPGILKCPDISCRVAFKRREELSHHIRRGHRSSRVTKSALGVRSMSQGRTL